MTNEERQNVIQALETAMGKWAEWVDECHGVKPECVMGEGDDWRKCTAALAIMRREDKRQPDAWQWLNTGNFRKKLPASAERAHWNPLYKD